LLQSYNLKTIPFVTFNALTLLTFIAIALPVVA
jgi:hypothetical protein